MPQQINVKYTLSALQIGFILFIAVFILRKTSKTSLFICFFQEFKLYYKI